MSDHTDIDRIADLCLNYKTPKQQFDELYDAIQRLERELNATQSALEQMTRDALTAAKDRDEWMTRAISKSNN